MRAGGGHERQAMGVGMAARSEFIPGTHACMMGLADTVGGCMGMGGRNCACHCSTTHHGIWVATQVRVGS